MGEVIITGSATGVFRKWIIPTIDAEDTLTMPKSQSTIMRKFNGDNYIGEFFIFIIMNGLDIDPYLTLDSIRFTSDNNVLSKSSNGRVEYWNLDTEKVRGLINNNIDTIFDFMHLDNTYI